MELPVVNHPDYVAKINDDNKFPIKKFGALAEYLLKKGVVNEGTATANIWGSLLANLRALTCGRKFRVLMASCTRSLVLSDTFSDPFNTLDTVDMATSARLATS